MSHRFETATAASSSIAVGADNDTPSPVRPAKSAPVAATSTVHRTVTSHVRPTASDGRAEPEARRKHSRDHELVSPSRHDDGALTWRKRTCGKLPQGRVLAGRGKLAECRRRAALFWLFVFVVAPGLVAAQEAVNYASVSGRVTDATGAALWPRRTSPLVISTPTCGRRRRPDLTAASGFRTSVLARTRSPCASPGSPTQRAI